MRTVEAKVVVLGSQGVGKTSLVVRQADKCFNTLIGPTIGATFFTCYLNVEEARVKLQVWDTAGQERFRSMAPMYYRNANAAFLVFDITYYDSFLQIKTWAKELQCNVEGPIVLTVIGNKSDLESRRQVPEDEALMYAQQIGAHYFEASALGGVGIEEIFYNTAVKVLLQSEQELTGSLKIYETNSDNSVTSIISAYSNRSTILNTSVSTNGDSSVPHAERPYPCC